MEVFAGKSVELNGGFSTTTFDCRKLLEALRAPEQIGAEILPL